MQYKTTPYFVKDIDVKSRMVTGIFAVHGNVDDGGDMSENGSFGKRLSDGSRKRVRFLWNHRSWDPPIASIKSIREVERAELPDKVIAWAPEASGGVEVTRKYYEGIELADWVFKGIQEEDIAEMSYAYDPMEFKIVNDEAKPKLRRVLTDVALYDISDVNWGMNPATAGVKHQGLRADIERFQAFLSELKEGRVLSASNREKVSSAVGAMENALVALNELLTASDGKGLPETGETLTERSARLVASLEEMVEWTKDRKAFRAAEGRQLSGELRERLEKVALELGVVLTETQPLADEKDVLAEVSKHLRLEAHLRGA